MPATRSKTRTTTSRNEGNSKEKELISALKTQLWVLQRNYDRCQKKLENVIKENEELKKLLKIGGTAYSGGEGTTNNEREEVTSETYNRLKTTTRARASSSIKCIRYEEGQEEIFNEASIEVKNESDEYMEMGDPQGFEDPLYFPSQVASCDEDEDELSNPAKQETRKTLKSSRNSRGRKNVYRKKSSWINKLRRATASPLISVTSSERAVIDFLDTIVNLPRKYISDDREDLSLLDMSGLKPFHVVLGKKLDSYLTDVAKNETSLGTVLDNEVPLQRSRHSIKYFKKPPPKTVEHDETTDISCGPSPSNDSSEDTEPQRLKNSNEVDKDELVPYICEVCGLPCDDSVRLKRHMISHTTGSERCPTCDKIFKRKDDMKRHIERVHERNFRFKCSMCPKKFTDSSGFRRHERVHLGIRPHLCSICGRRFPESVNLRLHMKSQHNGKEQPHRVKLVI